MYNRTYVTLAECDNDLQVLTKCQETRFFAQIKRNKNKLNTMQMSSQIITEAIWASF